MSGGKSWTWSDNSNVVYSNWDDLLSPESSPTRQSTSATWTTSKSLYQNSTSFNSSSTTTDPSQSGVPTPTANQPSQTTPAPSQPSQCKNIDCKIAVPAASISTSTSSFKGSTSTTYRGASSIFDYFATSTSLAMRNDILCAQLAANGKWKKVSCKSTAAFLCVSPVIDTSSKNSIFTSGATSCAYCDSGKYSDPLKSSTCSVCAAGKYSTTVGGFNSTVCESCLQGYFSTAEGSRSNRT